MKFTPYPLILLAACIGTDYLDDPKDPAILTDVTTLSLVTGQTQTIGATYYYNMWKADEQAELTWLSRDPEVASVSQSGKVTALTKGQTDIVILYPGEDTTTVRVNVVEGSGEVASVVIHSPDTSIDIGEMVTLSAVPYTLYGVEYTENYTVGWESSDLPVATIDGAGRLTGLSTGSVELTATINGVTSLPFTMMVGVSARIGVFQGNGGYQSTGTATLMYNPADQLILTFSSDFATSFALGTFVYLANSTSGTVVRTQGLEVAEVTSNGAKSYNISLINSQVSLHDYRYVVLLCKPASITFGYAELQ